MDDHRRRVLELASRSVSDSAFVDIVNDLRSAPIDEGTAVSRRTLQRYRLSHFWLQYGKELKLPCASGGEPISLAIASPQKLLQNWVDRYAGFASVYARALQRHGCGIDRPWHVVFYFDEAVPGNALAIDLNKKINVVFMNFVELGRLALTTEDMWLPIAVLRHNRYGEFLGGWSGVFKAILWETFGGDLSITNAGVALEIHGEPVLLFAVLGNIMGDADALKMAYGWKGASGLRCCLKCTVVSACNAESRAAGLEDICCTDFARLTALTDEDVWETHDILEAAHPIATITDFELLEKALGWKFDPHCLIADKALRQHCKPVSVATFDPTHCMCAHGILNFEFFLFFQACRRLHDIRYSNVREFCQASWQWPQMFTPSARDAVLNVFSGKRETHTKDKFKAGASETLAAYPLVRHFCQTIVHKLGGMELECASLVACCNIADVLLRRAKFCHLRPNDSYASSLSSIRCHLVLFKAAYGNEEVKPKHHYNVHIPGQVERDGGKVMECVTLERKLKLAVQACLFSMNTTSLEIGTLSRMLIAQERNLNDFSLEDRLLPPVADHAQLAHSLGGRDARVAHCLCYKGARIYRDDVLFVGRCATIVMLCIELDGALSLLVHPCTFLSSVTANAGRWSIDAALELVDLGSIAGGVRLAACWSKESAVELLVLDS